MNELGIVVLNENGEQIWKQDSDIITDFSIDTDIITLKFMDSPKIQLSLIDGKKID